MPTKQQLMQSISETIGDFREGEIERPTAEHVERWIEQFAADLHKPILKETAHVLDQTYISRTVAEEFLASLVTNEKLAGTKPRSFWKRCGILDIQSRGNSQKDMLQRFDAVLQSSCNLNVADCDAAGSTYVYLDDIIFSGMRVRNDLRDWLQGDAPERSTVHVITMANHSNGVYFANTNLRKIAKELGKKIDLHFWRCKSFKNQKYQKNASEVLWPASLPENDGVNEYAEMLTGKGFPPILRDAGYMGESQVFSSEEGRTVLESAFLQTGCHIRSICPNLPEVARPLGFSILKTLGFGAVTLTYRNCPNNSPLAFWVGDPWYPLLPRRTNQ